MIATRPSRQQLLHRTTVAVSVFCGCWAIAQAAPSIAQNSQPLFPPTNTLPNFDTAPQPTYESESFPAVPTTGNVPQTPLNTVNSIPRTIPDFSTAPNFAQTLYRVEIAGGDSFLLSQVQTVVPEAFLRYGDGTIQAGSFAEVGNAQRRVQLLASQGIAARMVTVGSNATYSPSYPAQATNPYPTQPATNYNPSYPQNSVPIAGTTNPNFISATQRSEEGNGGFFVVIPGRQEDLSAIAIQLIQLGMRPSAIQERPQPRGWHIAVGPFANREAADTWNSLFRSEGLDARLYFQ